MKRIVCVLTLVLVMDAAASSSLSPRAVVLRFYVSTDPGVCGLLTKHGLEDAFPAGVRRHGETALVVCGRLVRTVHLEHVEIVGSKIAQSVALIRVRYGWGKGVNPKRLIGCTAVDQVTVRRIGGRWLIDNITYGAPKRSKTCHAAP